MDVTRYLYEKRYEIGRFLDDIDANERKPVISINDRFKVEFDPQTKTKRLYRNLKLVATVYIQDANFKLPVEDRLSTWLQRLDLGALAETIGLALEYKRNK